VEDKMNLLGTNFRLYNKRLGHSRLVLLLLVALVLVACGGASETPTPEETSAEVQATDTPTVEEPTAEQPAGEAPTVAPQPEEATAEPVPATGQAVFLRVAMQPIVQTDPAFISSDSEVLVANHVYDYLIDIDPEASIIPRLATDWQVSDDGLTYTFTLADNVTWHDGDPFTADDVVWTFNRLRDPDLGSPTVDLYSNIVDVQATGDLEVTFTLEQTNPFFLFDLSDNHALIVKNGTEEATDFNGTGPFVVTNYSAEDRIEMAANENYFIDGQPRLDGVQIIFFGDETASVDALRGGQIDLAMRMSTSLFESLADQPGIATVEVPTNGFDLVRLRADRPPGDDPRVMQALRLATDRDAVFQLVQQGHGAIGNDTPIGPSYPNYYDPSIQPPGRDVEAARQLLADAGYGDGLDLTLHTPDTGGRPDLAAVLQSQWAEAGVNVEISVEPESVYYGDNGWLEVDLGITGWGHRPYPQFYLDVMLVCDAIWNESHFCDPEFDQLAQTAGTTLDEDERVEAYRQIQQLLVDRGPVIIPYYFAQFAAINDRFQNFELKPFAGRTDFRNVTFAE
jgi:peptide/nickel transport system substrate-binding protein